MKMDSDALPTMRYEINPPRGSSKGNGRSSGQETTSINGASYGNHLDMFRPETSLDLTELLVFGQSTRPMDRLVVVDDRACVSVFLLLVVRCAWHCLLGFGAK